MCVTCFQVEVRLTTVHAFPSPFLYIMIMISRQRCGRVAGRASAKPRAVSLSILLPSFPRHRLLPTHVRPFGDNRTPRTASRPSLAAPARRGPWLRHSHDDSRRNKRAVGQAKDRDVARSPLVSIMKVPTALFALASGASAHTIFQQMYVNGVSPGHQVGIRVPSYDGVRSLSHLFRCSRELTLNIAGYGPHVKWPDLQWCGEPVRHARLVSHRHRPCRVCSLLSPRSDLPLTHK
jgi:hypothetical protein